MAAQFLVALVVLAATAVITPSTAHAQRLTPWFSFGAQAWQRPDPTSGKVKVRLVTNSFNAHNQGANKDMWAYWTIWAIQRWNESTGAKPFLEWDGWVDNFPGVSPGILYVSMANAPVTITEPNANSEDQEADAFAESRIYLGVPGRPQGEVSGGQVIIYRKQNASSPDIIWGFRFNEAGFCKHGQNSGNSVTCANFVLLHELGHTLGLAHSCTNCPCLNPTAASKRVMRNAYCPEMVHEDLAGPRHDDVAAARFANGGGLQKIFLSIKHDVSFDNGATWQVQADNLPGSETHSGPAATATDYNGYFGLAWRGTDGGDHLNFIKGLSNNWNNATKVTFDWAGPQGVWDHPSLASNIEGHFLLGYRLKQEGDPALSDTREIRYINYERGAGSSNSGIQALPLSNNLLHRSSQPVAVSFTKPSCNNNGYWVMAQTSDGVSPGIFVRVAPVTTPPQTVAWPAEPVQLKVTNAGNPSSAMIGPVGGVGLACNRRCFDGDLGRCVLTYASGGVRSDESDDQAGYLRTASFYVTAAGTLQGVSGGTLFVTPWAFSSGHRTSGATAAAFNVETGTQTWHMAWNQQQDSCWRANKTSVGASFWPIPPVPCPRTHSNPQLRPMVTPGLAYSDAWNALLLFRAE